MIIESDGKMTKAQAKEIANFSLQGRMLMKKPEMKIKDFFRFCIGATAFCVLILLVFGFMLARGRGDALMYICLGMSVVTLAMVFSVYYSLNKIYKTLLSREGHVTVTLDTEGVEYDDHGSRKIRQSWSATSFVRQCQEMVYFMPTDITGLLVCVSAENAQGVKEFLKENDIKVKTVW